MTEISHGEVTRIREEVQKKFAQEQKTSAKRKEDKTGDEATQSNEFTTKGRGKDRGFVPLKAQFANSSSSWQDEPSAKKFKGKGQDGASWKKKKKKKSWGKPQDVKEEK